MAVRKVLALVLVLAACGGPAAAPPERIPEGATTLAAESPAAGTTATALERQRPDGPDAPAFVLALGQGGEFSPADETKPIYMVFWAEW